jgi:hypothetical protein
MGIPFYNGILGRRGLSGWSGMWFGKMFRETQLSESGELRRGDWIGKSPFTTKLASPLVGVYLGSPDWFVEPTAATARSFLSETEALLSRLFGMGSGMNFHDLYQTGARTHREVQFAFKIRDQVKRSLVTKMERGYVGVCLEGANPAREPA